MSAFETRRWPSREDILRIATEEAERLGVPVDDVIGANKKRAPSSARFSAWRRLIAETGCSMQGLATVWGCDRKSVWRGLKVAA